MTISSNSKLPILDTVPKLDLTTQDIPFVFTEGVKHPFLLHFKGDSMKPVIENGDWLLLDIDLKPQHSDIVAVYHNGNYTVGKYIVDNKTPFLVFEDSGRLSINSDDIVGVIISRHRYFSHSLTIN